MFSLALFLLLPAAVLSDWCYPQYCYESDGYDYISCDQEYNTCVPGTWLTYASCVYTGWADPTGAIYCDDYNMEACDYDWDTGYPVCHEPMHDGSDWSDWSDTAWNSWGWEDNTDWAEVQEDWDSAVKAGLGIVYTIIIVIVVIIVVSILLCILCCYCCGKGCCGKRRNRHQNVVIQNTVQPTDGGAQPPAVVPSVVPAAYPATAQYGGGGVYFNQAEGGVSVGQPYPPAPPQPQQHPVPMSYNQQPPAYPAKQ